jgi:hypothetical protein
MNIKNQMFRLLKSIILTLLFLGLPILLNAQDYSVGGFEPTENGALLLDPNRGSSSTITSEIVPNPIIGFNNPSAKLFWCYLQSNL